MVRNSHSDIYNALQENYLKTRDNKTLGEMYKIARDISYNYIQKYCQKKGIRLNIDEKSHDSALYVISKYLKKPDFMIKKISAYMHYGVLKTLFNEKQKKIDTTEVSYEEYMEIKHEEEDM
jgi:hypothetical protein